MTRYQTRIDLSEDTRKQLVDGLNVALGTTMDLASQVKQAHWNIRGPQFYARHELFDKLTDNLREWADDLAERATTLGGYANGTIRLSATSSKIEEYDLKAVQGRDHLEALAKRYGKYCAMMREMVGSSAKLDDPATEDLCTEVLRGAEMDLWFLEAHLTG